MSSGELRAGDAAREDPEAMERLKAEAAAHDDASGRGQARPGPAQAPDWRPARRKQMNFTDPESRLMKTAAAASSSATTRRWRSMPRGKSSWRRRDGDAADNGQLVPLEEQAG